MRTVYIHAGTHKTGTSSFQAMMVARRDHFLAHGVQPYLEPREGGPDGNCHTLAHAVLRAGVITGMRYAGAYGAPTCAGLRAVARAVRRCMDEAEGRDLLFSAEALGFLRHPAELARLRFLFGRAPVRIVPLVVFRQDDAWRASWTGQIARNPPLAADMGRPGFPLLAPWWFDKAAIRDFWQSAGPLREIAYDEALARDGSILPALMAAIGVPMPADGAYWLNRS